MIRFISLEYEPFEPFFQFKASDSKHLLHIGKASYFCLKVCCSLENLTITLYLSYSSLFSNQLIILKYEEFS